jgi:hypothetical protein
MDDVLKAYKDSVLARNRGVFLRKLDTFTAVILISCIPLYFHFIEVTLYTAIILSILELLLALLYVYLRKHAPFIVKAKGEYDGLTIVLKVLDTILADGYSLIPALYVYFLLGWDWKLTSALWFILSLIIHYLLSRDRLDLESYSKLKLLEKKYKQEK